ncbi:MAG: PIN domain-containing protein [Candidatus Sedimenticola sp. 6PFRAG7]
MHGIVFDTNILHQEGLSSRSMLLLLRLVEASHLEIFVPELVKKEFTSRKLHEAKENLKKSYDQLTLVTKKNSHDSEFQELIRKTQDSIKVAESKIEEQISKGFDFWETQYQVTILGFDSDTITQVMDDYFSGTGVYRKPKSRDDIPDAMINTTIMQLLTKKKELSVVLKDGAFKKHLQTIEGISTYDSLAEFLETGEVKSKLDELDASSEKAEQIKGFLNGEEFSDRLLQYLKHDYKEVEDIYLEDSEILAKEKLEVDSFGERVEDVNAHNIRDISIQNAAWFSDGDYSLEVSFTTEAGLYYCASYSEYLYLDEDTYRYVSLDSMNGDGLCDLSESMKLRFMGLVTVSVTDDLELEAVKAHSKYLGSPENPISLKLDIQTAEIL